MKWKVRPVLDWLILVMNTAVAEASVLDTLKIMHVAKRSETSSPQIIISCCDLYGKILDIVQNTSDSNLFIGLVFHVVFYFNVVNQFFIQSCIVLNVSGLRSKQTCRYGTEVQKVKVEGGRTVDKEYC
jgi:hypothetical protein